MLASTLLNGFQIKFDELSEENLIKMPAQQQIYSFCDEKQLRRLLTPERRVGYQPPPYPEVDKI